MRILIIEDEEKIANFLSKGLKESGFIVSTAKDGQEGLFLAQEYSFDLVILDIMLPKLDGWAVIKQLRLINPSLRILFLTARSHLNDKIKGFDLGADDYVVKPFSFSELLARIKALLRRANSKPVDTIEIADLRIDLITHKVTREQTNIYLTTQEFALLNFLAQHVGEVLSRTLIAESVWDINFDSGTNVVDVAIKRLRHKIDDPFEKKLIHTIRGIGYAFKDH